MVTDKHIITYALEKPSALKGLSCSLRYSYFVFCIPSPLTHTVTVAFHLSQWDLWHLYIFFLHRTQYLSRDHGGMKLSQALLIYKHNCWITPQNTQTAFNTRTYLTLISSGQWWFQTTSHRYTLLTWPVSSSAIWSPL